MCSVYQVVSILIINDIIVAVKTRKYFQSLKNCVLKIVIFVKLDLNMSKVIGKILSVYQKPLPWKVVYSKAILYIRYFNRAKANQTWLSLASIAAPISQKRELWKGISNQNMKWLTSDVRSVNSQQLAKISLENIHSQSIMGINSSAQNVLKSSAEMTI